MEIQADPISWYHYGNKHDIDNDDIDEVSGDGDENDDSRVLTDL